VAYGRQHPRELLVYRVRVSGSMAMAAGTDQARWRDHIDVPAPHPAPLRLAIRYSALM
jgi:hypothetical protein